MPTLKLNPKHFLICDENLETLPEFEYGNFALGFVNEQHHFVPAFVGRTNSNIREDIKATCNQKLEEGKKYTHYKYKRAPDELYAYEKECRNFHDYTFRKDGTTKQLDNMMHPSKPNGGGSCPVEGCYQ
jgi:hypothetical protein